MPGSAARDAVASRTETATGQSGAIPIARGSSTPAAITLGFVVTAATGTTPSITFEVQWSFDGGATFMSGPSADTLTAMTAAATKAQSFAPKGDAYRIKWTISGTTPSFTFSVREVLL